MYHVATCAGNSTSQAPVTLSVDSSSYSSLLNKQCSITRGRPPNSTSTEQPAADGHVIVTPLCFEIRARPPGCPFVFRVSTGTRPVSRRTERRKGTRRAWRGMAWRGGRRAFREACAAGQRPIWEGVVWYGISDASLT
jgi:hypothetical protein